MAATPTRVRVYVGGLPADVTEKELTERFSRFVVAESCRLESVELLAPKGIAAALPIVPTVTTKSSIYGPGPSSSTTSSSTATAAATHRGFAYLTLTGVTAPTAMATLVKTYHKTKWRGSILRVEPAELDYRAKLELEWVAQREQQAQRAAAIAAAYGLVASPTTIADVRVGGVAFCGHKRTSFDYADVDFNAVFAAKRTATTRTQAPVQRTNAATATTAATSDADDDDDDDADYWATSGDESDEQQQEQQDEQQEEKVLATPDASLVTSSSSSSSEEHEEEEDDDAIALAIADDAVAIDDVEAFVQQMLLETNAQDDDASNAIATAATNQQRTLDRDAANARRIAALAIKKQQQQQSKLHQTIAIHATTTTTNKKITFDDSGNEEDFDTGKRASAAVTNWLDSSDDDNDDDTAAVDYTELHDGSDDEARRLAGANFQRGRNVEFLNVARVSTDDDDDDASAFAIRPEFLGERGKRLFELQKRFGGDQRFRMDARFIDDTENEFGGTDGLVDDVDDDAIIGADGPIVQLQTFQQEDDVERAAAFDAAWRLEQDAALAVVALIYPDVDVDAIKYRLRIKSKQDPLKEAAWMGRLARYDPRDRHARDAYELPIEAPRNSNSTVATRDDDDDVAVGDLETPKRPAKVVVTGGDRFFATSSALGSLFTRVRKNSEDGIAGEAALDGVFRLPSRSNVDNRDRNEGIETQGAGAATFQLSALFDFPVGHATATDDASQQTDVRALGASLFETEEDLEEREDATPWHFTQAFAHREKEEEGNEDVHMATDDEDDGEEVEEEVEEKKKKKQPKVVLQKSLSEFLAFGWSFTAATAVASVDWSETRKKLTLDYKRKRRDALRNKKKLQKQYVQQHKKKQRMSARE